MSLLNILERRFQKFAVPGLVRNLSIAMLITYGVEMATPGAKSSLDLNMWLVFQGQIWRLLTFLIVPPDLNPIFFLFALQILVMTGDGLEEAWGSFKTTLYYAVGVFATILVAVIFWGIPVTNSFVNASLFLAFATLYPDYEILVFFILPVKVKYLGMLSGLWVFVTLLTGPIALKLVAILSVLNWILFFGPDIVLGTKRYFSNRSRRMAFERQLKPMEQTRHRCSICGKTEMDNPELEFRYCTCRECNGGKEYCLADLKTHKNKENNK
ncbi:hypothetical protein HYY75_10900 [bacterium]|nr:hypothetical protein [bacterium]